MEKQRIMQDGDAFLKAYQVLQSLEKDEKKRGFLRRSFAFGRRNWSTNPAGFRERLRSWISNFRNIVAYPGTLVRRSFALRPHALPLSRFAVPAAVAAIAVLMAGIWQHSGWKGYKTEDVAAFPPAQDSAIAGKNSPNATSKAEIGKKTVASPAVQEQPAAVAEARQPEPVVTPQINQPLESLPTPAERMGMEHSVSKPDPMAIEWQHIKDSHKIADFQAFLKKYPSGSYSANAIEMSEQLRWGAIDKQNLNSVRAYLDENPQGRYTVEARQQLGTLLQQQRVLQARAEEEHAWNLVDPKAEDSIQHFLAQYPNGNHASAAQELLNRLTKQEQERTLAMADESAWSKVAWRDRHSLEQYVNQFPAGKHTDQARQLLATLPTPTVTGASPAVDSREAIAVVATLKKYSDAWSAKDLDDITALRPGLGRKLAKQELSSARSIVMRIHPTSAPSIEGDRATVECIHQVDEVFTDGTEKQNHGMRMTYVLVKRGGSWLIADSR
jgi:TolA-binding protein